MALLFVESFTRNNGRVVQISVKILELLLLLAGLISTLVMVKGAVAPYSCEIVFSSLVGFWGSIKCFLSSLSNCIIIHVMVLLIAASSAFCRRENRDQDDEITGHDHALQIAESLPPPLAEPPLSLPWYSADATPPPPSPRNISEVAAAAPLSGTRISIRSTTTGSTLYIGSRHNCTEENSGKKAELFSNEIKKKTRSANSSPDSGQLTITTNHPPLLEKWKDVFIENDEVTSSLSEEDTMDATWKAITGGGKQRPKKKHLQKSETWDVPPRPSVAVPRLDSEELLPTSPKWKELRKAETFNDAVSATRRAGLRRGPSMSLEELNQLFEAFIKKSNDNMRLQRQESDRRFFERMNQGL